MAGLFTGPLVFGPSKPPPPTKRPRIFVDDRKVKRAFKNLFPEFKTIFAKELEVRVGPQVRDAIKQETPVLTGDLKSSVRKGKPSVLKTRVVIPIKVGGIKGPARGQTIRYAAIVHELGSPKGRGRFFVINPAVKTGEKVLPQAVADAMRFAVARAR